MVLVLTITILPPTKVSSSKLRISLGISLSLQSQSLILPLFQFGFSTEPWSSRCSYFTTLCPCDLHFISSSRLNVQDLMAQNVTRIGHVLPQHRDVEHVVNRGHARRQGQTICHFNHLIEDFKSTTTKSFVDVAL